MEEDLSLKVWSGIEVLLGNAFWRAVSICVGGRVIKVKLGSVGGEMLRTRGISPHSISLGKVLCPRRLFLLEQENHSCPLQPPGAAPHTFSQVELDPAGVLQLAVGCDALIGSQSPGQQLLLTGDHKWLRVWCSDGLGAEVSILWMK